MLSRTQRLMNWLQVYTSMRLGKTDPAWDQALQEAMTNNVKPQSTGRHDHTVLFGDVEVWVQNWPYCYGHLYYYHDSINENKTYPLPSRSTALKLKNYLSQHQTGDCKKSKIKAPKVMRKLSKEHVQRLRSFREKIFGEKAVFMDLMT